MRRLFLFCFMVFFALPAHTRTTYIGERCVPSLQDFVAIYEKGYKICRDSEWTNIYPFKQLDDCKNIEQKSKDGWKHFTDTDDVANDYVFLVVQYSSSKSVFKEVCKIAKSTLKQECEDKASNGKWDDKTTECTCPAGVGHKGSWTFTACKKKQQANSGSGGTCAEGTYQGTKQGNVQQCKGGTWTNIDKAKLNKCDYLNFDGNTFSSFWRDVGGYVVYHNAARTEVCVFEHSELQNRCKQSGGKPTANFECDCSADGVRPGGRSKFLPCVKLKSSGSSTKSGSSSNSSSSGSTNKTNNSSGTTDNSSEKTNSSNNDASQTQTVSSTPPDAAQPQPRDYVAEGRKMGVDGDWRDIPECGVQVLNANWEFVNKKTAARDHMCIFVNKTKLRRDSTTKLYKVPTPTGSGEMCRDADSCAGRAAQLDDYDSKEGVQERSEKAETDGKAMGVDGDWTKIPMCSDTGGLNSDWKLVNNGWQTDSTCIFVNTKKLKPNKDGLYKVPEYGSSDAAQKMCHGFNKYETSCSALIAQTKQKPIDEKANDTKSETKTITVQGTVKKLNKQTVLAVGGADVTIVGTKYSAKTNKNGEYKIKNVAVTIGKKIIVKATSGELFKTETIQVSNNRIVDDTLTASLQLVSYYLCSGSIKTSTGSFLTKAVNISYTGEEGTASATVTDGKFSINVVPEGQIKFSADGYNDYTCGFDAAGACKCHNVIMQQKSQTNDKQESKLEDNNNDVEEVVEAEANATRNEEENSVEGGQNQVEQSQDNNVQEDNDNEVDVTDNAALTGVPGAVTNLLDNTYTPPTTEMSEEERKYWEQEADAAQEDYQAAKARRDDWDNRLLAATTTAAAGAGGYAAFSALGEQAADRQAEQDMAALLGTMHCEYGKNKNIQLGLGDIEIPGGNELLKYYTEYKETADRLKRTKAALNLPAGLEATTIYDKAETNLYRNASLGGRTGGETSLARAMMDGDSADAAAWAAQKEETAKNLRTGALVGAGALVAGFVANKLMNPKSERHKKAKRDFEQAEREFNNENSQYVIKRDSRTTLTYDSLAAAKELANNSSGIPKLESDDSERVNLSELGLKADQIFDSGKYDLNNAGESILNRYVAKFTFAIQDNPDTNIVLNIVGHTDRVGVKADNSKYKNNQELSELRAKSVAEYLEDRLSAYDNVSFKSSGVGAQDCDKEGNAPDCRYVEITATDDTDDGGTQ
jgi:outer membrane protein OmpA-like peptidoglycan-associated protein